MSEKLLKKLKRPNKDQLYKEETERLLKSRKEEMISDLYKIINNLKEKKDINEFIESKIDYLKNTILFSDMKKEQKCEVFAKVKLFGFIFLAFYLMGIYPLIGLKNSLEVEFLNSIILFFKRNRTSTNFYQRYYLEISLPKLSFFFIFSFLSNFFVNKIYFPLLEIIMLILNGFIFISLKNFPFKKGDEVNENYNLKNFLILFLYVFYFNILLGIMGLIPIKIILTGYFYYEKWLNKIKYPLKNNNNIIEDELNNNEENNSNFLHSYDIDNEPNNKIDDFGKYNGLYFSYIFSFLLAIFFHSNSNFEIINDLQIFFKNIFILHFIFIMWSIISYCFFETVFKKKSEKIENNMYITKFCGYLIFRLKKKKKNNVCCEGCRIGMRKFYYCCCCKFCQCCDCLECKTCCPCLPLFECCKEEADLTEIGERDKSICICYQLNGKCSWICEYLSDKYIFFCTVLIIIMELFNFGFKSVFTEYMKNIASDKIGYYKWRELQLINLVYILSIFFFYCFQLLNGYIFIKFFPLEGANNYGEGYLLGSGILLFIISESLISCILSSLIYYKIIENFKYHFMVFSISANEFLKLLISNQICKVTANDSKLLTSSSFISLILLIFHFIIYIINYSVKEHNNFILFQIYFSGFIFFISICSILFVIISLKKLGIKEYKDFENLEKKFEQERRDMIIDIEEFNKEIDEETEKRMKEENKGKKQDEKEEKEDKNVEEDEKEEKEGKNVEEDEKEGKEGKNVEEDEKEGKGMEKPENNNYCNDQIININNDDDN